MSLEKEMLDLFDQVYHRGPDRLSQVRLQYRQEKGRGSPGHRSRHVGFRVPLLRTELGKKCPRLEGHGCDRINAAIHGLK